jgi:hypothetical protein
MVLAALVAEVPNRPQEQKILANEGAARANSSLSSFQVKFSSLVPWATEFPRDHPLRTRQETAAEPAPQSIRLMWWQATELSIEDWR